MQVAVLQGRKFKLAEQRAAISDEGEGGAATPRVTSRVGGDLRAAREHIGWTLPAVAAHLRIRLPFLEAIEEGRIADLPGNAYAVGFLRTYASELGLDPDEIARRFKAEAAEVNRKTELAFPAPVPERGVPAGAVILVGAVIAVGAYAAWYRVSGNERPSSDMVQSVPDRLAPLANLAPPTPAIPPAPTATLTPAPASGQGDSLAAQSVPPASNPGGPPASPARPTTLAAASPPMAAAALPPSGGARLAVAPSPAPSGAVPLAGVPDGTRIVLRAKADAWMQVREKQGPVLLNRVLRSGETWPVPPNRPQLLLTTGNAAGTELLVDGTTSPSLGGDGAVRRDLPLDPEMIRTGKLALGSPAPTPGKPPATTPATRTN